MAMGRRVFVGSAEPSAVRDAVFALEPAAGDMVCVLMAAQDAPDLDDVVARVGETKSPFFGALFPALIDGVQTRYRGALVFAVPALADPMLVRGLDTDRFRIPDCLPLLRASAAQGVKPTAMVLLDGAAPNISLFLQGLYNQLGAAVSYWGGGAGSGSHRAQRCVFTGEGVAEGAAVVALSALPARMGVGHGWREIKGPFVVARSKRNVIAQLNWENALERYRSVVERDADVKITHENFYEVASAYPFGIRKESEEVVVRCPVSIGDGGTLVCAGEVPENAILSILKGEPDLLVAAAGRAAQDARPDADVKVRHCLLADCMSRVRFLQDRFGQELAAIDAGLRGMTQDCSPLGMLTLGEISSDGEAYLDYFNKTCVVAVLHEP
jgi:hypothetical protein